MSSTVSHRVPDAEVIKWKRLFGLTVLQQIRGLENLHIVCVAYIHTHHPKLFLRKEKVEKLLRSELMKSRRRGGLVIAYMESLS